MLMSVPPLRPSPPHPRRANGIGPAGAEAIAAALKGHTGLKELNLGCVRACMRVRWWWWGCDRMGGFLPRVHSYIYNIYKYYIYIYIYRDAPLHSWGWRR